MPKTFQFLEFRVCTVSKFSRQVCMNSRLWWNLNYILDENTVFTMSGFLWIWLSNAFRKFTSFHEHHFANPLHYYKNFNYISCLNLFLTLKNKIHSVSVRKWSDIRIWSLIERKYNRKSIKIAEKLKPNVGTIRNVIFTLKLASKWHFAFNLKGKCPAKLKTNLNGVCCYNWMKTKNQRDLYGTEIFHNDRFLFKIMSAFQSYTMNISNIDVAWHYANSKVHINCNIIS